MIKVLTNMVILPKSKINKKIASGWLAFREIQPYMSWSQSDLDSDGKYVVYQNWQLADISE